MSKYYFGQNHIYTSRDTSQGPNADKVYLKAGKGETLILEGSIAGGGSSIDLEETGPLEYIDISGTSNQSFSGPTSNADYGTVVAISGNYAFTYDKDNAFTSRFDTFVKSGSTWSFDLAYAFTACPPSSINAIDMMDNFMVATSSGSGGYAAFLTGSTWNSAYQTGTSMGISGDTIAVWSDGRCVGVDVGVDATELQTIEPDGSNDYPSSSTDYTVDAMTDVTINDNYIITGHGSLNKIVIRNRSTPSTEVLTINGTSDFGKFVFANQSYIGTADTQTIYLYSNDSNGTLINCFNTGLTLTNVRCSKTTNGNIVYTDGSSIRYIHYDPNVGIYIDNGAGRSLTKTNESLAIDDDFVLSGDSISTTNGQITFRQNTTTEVDPSTYSKIEITDSGININTVGNIDISNSLTDCVNKITIGPFTSTKAKIDTLVTESIISETGSLSISGNTDVTGTFDVTGNTDITGTFDVTGDTDITGDLTVSKSVTTQNPYYYNTGNIAVNIYTNLGSYWNGTAVTRGTSPPTRSGGVFTFQEAGIYAYSACFIISGTGTAGTLFSRAQVSGIAGALSNNAKVLSSDRNDSCISGIIHGSVGTTLTFSFASIGGPGTLNTTGVLTGSVVIYKLC